MDSRSWDRIADSYFDEISSPFEHPSIINPLLDYLDTLPGRERMRVADLGCGIGNLLPFLSERYREVVAVDFSAKMLRHARRHCRRKNVHFARRSILDLSCFAERFDVVVSVNSVLSPRLDEVDRALASMASTLKPEGTLAGIFPSMESVLYESVLAVEKQRDLGIPEAQAIRRARRMAPGRYDFVLGVFTDGADRQKFYYSFELRKRLQRAGFRGVQLGKLVYPAAPGQPRTWDWFVRASAGKRAQVRADILCA